MAKLLKQEVGVPEKAEAQVGILMAREKAGPQAVEQKVMRDFLALQEIEAKAKKALQTAEAKRKALEVWLLRTVEGPHSIEPGDFSVRVEEQVAVRPAYKEELEKRLGPAVIEEIRANTPPSITKHIKVVARGGDEVAVPEPGAVRK